MPQPGTRRETTPVYWHNPTMDEIRHETTNAVFAIAKQRYDDAAALYELYQPLVGTAPFVDKILASAVRNMLTNLKAMHTLAVRGL